MSGVIQYKRVICIKTICLSIVLFFTYSVSAQNSNYQTLDWTELMPADDLEALWNPPDYINELPEGSPLDNVDASNEEFSPADPYQSALVSTRVVEDLVGEKVNLPGFIVPLEFDESMTVTQFFLVPYFGACIHLPPPPPNQMVLVDYPEGIEVSGLYTAFWISGELESEITENSLGTSAYRMQMDSFETY